MERSLETMFSATVEEVLAALTDVKLIEAKFAPMGHKDFELLDSSESGGRIVRSYKRTVPVNVPGFAPRVLKPENVSTQRDEWEPAESDGSRHGTFEIAAAGTPVKVRGTMELAPKGKTSCTYRAIANIEVKVPLIGGKIAGFVAGDVDKGLAQDAEFTAAALKKAIEEEVAPRR